MGFRGWDCRNWIPKYLEISSVLLHVLLHAQAELLDPLPLGVHSSAVGLENTEKGTGKGAFTARRDRNDQNLAAARRVWTQELADPVSVSLWLTHPRCLRQESFAFTPWKRFCFSTTGSLEAWMTPEQPKLFPASPHCRKSSCSLCLCLNLRWGLFGNGHLPKF